MPDVDRDNNSLEVFQNCSNEQQICDYGKSTKQSNLEGNEEGQQQQNYIKQQMVDHNSKLKNTSPRVLNFLGFPKPKSKQIEEKQNPEPELYKERLLQLKKEENLINYSNKEQGKDKQTLISERRKGSDSLATQTSEYFHSAQHTLKQQNQDGQLENQQKNGNVQQTQDDAPGCLPKFNLTKNQNRSKDLKQQKSKQRSLDLDSKNQTIKDLVSMGVKLQYGQSLEEEELLNDQQQDPSHRQKYSQIDPKSFKVRGQYYQSDKKKVPCEGCVYDLVGADLISLPFKQYNIASIINLPESIKYEEQVNGQPIDSLIPPVFVVNVCLPMYSPSLFNSPHDGKGHSLIYYFRLSKEFRPQQNPDQMKVFQQIRDTINQDLAGSQQQQRLRSKMKLIPRVSNVQEFAKSMKLNKYQVNLLNTYKEKPMLTKPCHQYFVDFQRGYWEFDLDVHMYAYVLRQAFHQFQNKTTGIVFENTFVLQGEGIDELPELILGGIKIHRIDLNNDYSLEEMIKKQIAKQQKQQSQANEQPSQQDQNNTERSQSQQQNQKANDSDVNLQQVELQLQDDQINQQNGLYKESNNFTEADQSQQQSTIR